MSGKAVFADVPRHTKSVIFALEGPVLSEREAALFREAQPLGFILFDKPGARNIKTPAQLKALTQSLKAALGWDCPVLIDQEGGRVQRMKAPHWPSYPAAQVFGDQAADHMDDALEALRLNTLAMAGDLIEAGVNVNCTPVLDVLFAETHDIIGDRAFGNNPNVAGRLALSVCRHMLAAGVMPVIKHIPGHGRAKSDSHHELPVVHAARADLQEIDFKPFQVVANSEIGHCVWAMSAHVVYDALDPDHPASTSGSVIRDIIRGEIGFDGLLVSDDLDMKALDRYGGVSARAEACLGAGCDVVLHCSGNFEDMQKLANSVPNLSAEALKRLQNEPNIA